MDKISSTDEGIAEAFNTYYSNAVKSQNLQCDSEHLNESYMVLLELVKVFNFVDKKLGFLEAIDLCLNLGIRFCIT